MLLLSDLVLGAGTQPSQAPKSELAPKAERTKPLWENDLLG
jgi:hypothetical protein